MIPLLKMSKEAEETYYQAVLKIVMKMDNFPLGSCMPKNRARKLDRLFLNMLHISFRDFILASYKDLCEFKKILEDKGPTGIRVSINAQNGLPDRLVNLNHCQACKFRGQDIVFSKFFVGQIFEKFSSSKDYLSDLLHQSKLNIWIKKQYNLLVCPYCNINYTYSRNKTILGAQLDHFFCKEKYPIFAACLYNLVPCCSTCNNAKRTYESHLSPFDTDVNFNQALQFSYYILSSDFLYSPESIAIRLKYIGDNGNLLCQDMEKTGAKEAYTPFNAYVHKILLKSYIYNEVAVDMFIQQYPDLFKTKDDVLSLVFGNNFWNNKNVDEIYKSQSLSRLTHDLLEELRLL